MKLIDIHWGWITPGVGQANRARQLDLYLDLLEARVGKGERFYFSQPGWLLDVDASATVRHITATTPERGKSNGPMTSGQLDRFRAAVRRGQLVYLAYPYSGAVVEGMTGESVLRALRLTRAIASQAFETNVTGFFVHDGPFQLDWNAPMVPQIGRMAGFREIFGRSLAMIVSPDGTRFPMIGQPEEGAGLLCSGVEAPDATEHLAELEQRFGPMRCAGEVDVKRLVADAALSPVASQSIRTKGWYGGAPLVMQQQAALRRTDLAITLLGFNLAQRSEQADLTDLWKRSLVLQDCHLQWLLANVDTHYLPLARDLETEVRRCLPPPGEGDTVATLAFNPLAHRRSGVVRVGMDYAVCRDVAPASTAMPEADAATRVHASPTSLVNDRIRVELGPSGEILSVRDKAGETLYSGRANQLRHWINQPAEGTFLLKQMGVWEERFSGCLRLETEVHVPEDGLYPFFLDITRGMVVAVACGEDDWVPATNLHWGGGLPSGNQEHGHSQAIDLDLHRGDNRLILYAVADEGFKMREAAVRLNGSITSLRYWTVNKAVEWVPDPFQIDAVAVHEQGARASVVFSGHFSTCRATMTLSLDHDSPRVDVSLKRTYADRVYEGMQTLPLPLDVGSYLGSYCERPYVPAFTVEHETPLRHTVYTSDKPYGFCEAYDSDQAWNTGRFRSFFGGMAPFLGIFTALAESTTGSLAMLTDGHGHFFRRRPNHAAAETLGLSLGSSVIHPMTQNYRASKGSYWEKITRSAKGVDYDDAHETSDFVAPEGDIVCAWSLLFSANASISRQECHHQLLERTFPLLPASRPTESGYQLIGEDVILTALERDDDTVTVRLVNLSPDPQHFVLSLPWPVQRAEVNTDMPIPNLMCRDCGMTGELPPLAVREIHLA